MSLPSKVVVITGASRGLGWEFVNQLLLTPTPPHVLLTKEHFCNNDYTVVALVRSIDEEKWSGLQDKLTTFNTANGSSRKLKTVQCDVTNLTEIKSLTELIKTELNDRVDVFISNAGITEKKNLQKLSILTEFDENIETVFEVNAIAPVIFTNHLAPFLINAAKSVAKCHGIDLDAKKAKDESSSSSSEKTLQYAQSIYISTILGSIATVAVPYMSTYRASKAALNMYVRTLSFEYPIINFLPIHPGWVATDLGSANGTPPLVPVDSIRGMLNIMDTYCYQESSGAGMIGFDGQQLPW